MGPAAPKGQGLGAPRRATPFSSPQKSRRAPTAQAGPHVGSPSAPRGLSPEQADGLVLPRGCRRRRLPAWAAREQRAAFSLSSSALCPVTGSLGRPSPAPKATVCECIRPLPSSLDQPQREGDVEEEGMMRWASVKTAGSPVHRKTGAEPGGGGEVDRQLPPRVLCGTQAQGGPILLFTFFKETRNLQHTPM